MFEVWIDNRALDRMAVEASALYPLETGGICVGYRSGGAQVIADAIMGGPNARHSQFKFEPDHEWQCEQLDRIYEESGGTLVYLGDWHTHPNGRVDMSWDDRRTLQRIACSKTAGASNPIMVIGAGSASAGWEWAVHVYLGRRLLGIKVDVATTELIGFNRPPSAP